jgi:hypothetical protein
VTHHWSRVRRIQKLAHEHCENSAANTIRVEFKALSPPRSGPCQDRSLPRYVVPPRNVYVYVYVYVYVHVHVHVCRARSPFQLCRSAEARILDSHYIHGSRPPIGNATAKTRGGVTRHFKGVCSVSGVDLFAIRRLGGGGALSSLSTRQITSPGIDK